MTDDAPTATAADAATAAAGLLVPGALVRHPQQPDWGLGQVQSAIGNRVTVTFDEIGKVVIDASRVPLEPVP